LIKHREQFESNDDEHLILEFSEKNTERSYSLALKSDEQWTEFFIESIPNSALIDYGF
jgi:hypothetical protein